MFRFSLVVLFAVAVGHLAWHALGGSTVPDYCVGGQVSAMCGPNPDERQLYLRREIFLSQRPRRAWLQVLGQDRLRLYVNGMFLQGQSLPGLPVAIVVDMAPFLQVGRNVIAIAAEQHTLGQPPRVAVEGAYAFDQEEFRIQSDPLWRCRAVFERKSAWWFETDFHDRHWPHAKMISGQLRAKVEEPPRATTEAGVGQWIALASLDEGSAAIRRDFDIAGRPGQAWLRVTATSSYRLALNGVLLDQQEDQLGALVAVPPVQRTYDITPLVRRGHNGLAFVLTATAGHVPRLLVDLEIEDRAGGRSRLGTDRQWLTRSGLPSDWLDMTPNDPAAWQPCQTETGDVLTPPWLPRRQFVALQLPWVVVLWQAAGQLGLIAVIAVLTWLACNLAANTLALRFAWFDSSGRVAFLALVPATVGIAAAVLATYDPRIARQDVYQTWWLVLAVASAPAQWSLLGAARSWGDWRMARKAKIFFSSLAPRLSSLLIIGLVVLGFWLRVRDIVTEGLQWDEVENYHATFGFLERGFPSLKVHDDLPHLYIHTSELQFIPMALAALVFNDPAYVVRFPAVCSSTLTIWLIFHVGRRWFNTAVGLLAATIYTLAPVCIAMSNFGRYFNQLQFFVLLTMYYFWLTLRGAGPIDRRALWLTALSFLGLFLTWEASALIAPGMVVAALVHRRGHLRPVLCTPAVWAAMVLVVLVIVIQASHVILQQTRFLWYGISLSDVKLIPMWRYPIPGVFQPWYYIWQSSWTQDALLPLLGLLGALALAVRHAWRRPVRFLLIIHLATCLLMAFLLPNTQWRYIHHLVPLPILLGSAVLVAGARWLGRAGMSLTSSPAPFLAYTRGVGLLFVVALAALASGLTVELRELTSFRVEGHGLTGYKFPNLAAAARYLGDHMQEGDVMLANNVYQIHHLMGIHGRPNRPLDFMPATGPFLPGTVDDRRSVLLDRRDGTQMISTPETMVELFARHRRIWYVVQPGQHYILNTPDVSTFLRQHMEVVYEDWEALVLFRGDNHRPAFLRLENERALNDAQANFLP